MMTKIHIVIIDRPLKDVVKIMASNWYTAQIMLYKTQLSKTQISKEEYLAKVVKLMTLPILREKAPDWLHAAVDHLTEQARSR